jgi:hypothetical protein
MEGQSVKIEIILQGEDWKRFDELDYEATNMQY